MAHYSALSSNNEDGLQLHARVPVLRAGTSSVAPSEIEVMIRAPHLTAEGRVSECLQAFDPRSCALDIKKRAQEKGLADGCLHSQLRLLYNGKELFDEDNLAVLFETAVGTPHVMLAVSDYVYGRSTPVRSSVGENDLEENRDGPDVVRRDSSREERELVINIGDGAPTALMVHISMLAFNIAAIFGFDSGSEKNMWLAVPLVVAQFVMPRMIWVLFRGLDSFSIVALMCFAFLPTLPVILLMKDVGWVTLPYYVVFIPVWLLYLPMVMWPLLEMIGFERPVFAVLCYPLVGIYVFVLFLVLRLDGFIDWEWWVVFIPIDVELAFFMSILILAFVVEVMAIPLLHHNSWWDIAVRTSCLLVLMSCFVVFLQMRLYDDKIHNAIVFAPFLIAQVWMILLWAKTAL